MGTPLNSRLGNARKPTRREYGVLSLLVSAGILAAAPVHAQTPVQPPTPGPALAQQSDGTAAPPKAADVSGQSSQTGAAQQTPQAKPPSKPTKRPTAAGNNVVTVTAAPEEAVRTSIDRRSYSVATDLQGSGGSLADALRNIPGAEVDINGNLSLRGGPVQIMIDGQPSAMFSGQSAGQVLQSMPADRIDRVEVITTPTAAFSPEGQAGIINLVTKKSAPAGTSGGMRANVGGAGRKNVAGNWAYTKDKLTVAADGGWRRDLQHFDWRLHRYGGGRGHRPSRSAHPTVLKQGPHRQLERALRL